MLTVRNDEKDSMHMYDQQLLCEIIEMDEKKVTIRARILLSQNIIMYKGVMSYSNNILKSWEKISYY